MVMLMPVKEKVRSRQDCRFVILKKCGSWNLMAVDLFCLCFERMAIRMELMNLRLL